MAVSWDQVEHARFISPCCQPYHHSPLKPDFSLPLLSLQNASHFVYAMGKIYNLFKCIDSINIKQIILNRQQNQKPLCRQSLLWVTHRPPLCTSCCTPVCRSDTSKRLFLDPLIIQPSLWMHCGHCAISKASAVINCSFTRPAIAPIKHSASISRVPKPSLHRAGEAQLCPWCHASLPWPWTRRKKEISSFTYSIHSLFSNGSLSSDQRVWWFLRGLCPLNGSRNNTNNKPLLMGASFRHCCMESHLNQTAKGEGFRASSQTS